MRSKIRWALAFMAPLTLMVGMTMGANAAWWGMQLHSWAPTAYHHCSSQTPDGHPFHCMNTPYLWNWENNYWYTPSFSDPVLESWSDYNWVTLANTSDYVNGGAWSDWYDVYQDGRVGNWHTF